jgi:hypothetical protein
MVFLVILQGRFAAGCIAAVNPAGIQRRVTPLRG